MNTLYKYEILINSDSYNIKSSEFKILEKEGIVDINGSLLYLSHINLDSVVVVNDNNFSITCYYFTLETDKSKITSKIKNEILEFLTKKNKELNQKIENNVKMAKELFLLMYYDDREKL